MATDQELQVDEFHHKATRTLFMGNLKSDISPNHLRTILEKFGEIISINIIINRRNVNTDNSTATAFAFVQYSDICSAVEALRSLDGELVNGSRVNMGFRVPEPTACAWIGGISASVTVGYLASQFNRFGKVKHCMINRAKEQALVFFREISHAQAAVTQMHGSVFNGRRIQADFASKDYQQVFQQALPSTSAELTSNTDSDPKSSPDSE